MLLVAVIAVLVSFRRARVSGRSLAWWFGSVLLFAGGVMAFDRYFYGGTLKTGYGAGEITFGLGAVIPNLRLMPPYLVKAIPALLLGLAALTWMAVRAIRSRSTTADPRTTARFRRDAVVGLVLAAGWFGLWALYSAYNWTAQAGSGGGGGSGRGIPPHPFLSPGNRPHRPARCLAARATAQVAAPCDVGRHSACRVLLFPWPHGGWGDGVSRWHRIPGWVTRRIERCESPAAEL